uniref:Uncharacterized protein n=2 Tax=Clastoptera arizonana TaxID=38151 RepID=A0A1B6C0T7_9HEMI
MKDGSLSIELLPNLLFLHMTVDSLGCISNFNYKEVISDYLKPWDKYAIYIFKKALPVQWLESVGYSVIFVNDLLSKLEFHISQASNLAEDIKNLRFYYNFKIKDNILSFDLKKYASRCWLRITIDISSTDIRHTDISSTNIIGDVKLSKIQNIFKDLPPEKYKLSSFAKQILINLTKLNRIKWNN